MLSAFIAMPRLRVRWMIALIGSLASVALGWYLGGRPELYWPLERERLNVLFEYSQKVHVGNPLAFTGHDCRPDLGATRADNSHAFTVYMIGYGEDSCCVGDGCSAVGFKIRTGNGFTATVLMIQSKEKARSFGMPMIDDGNGEHFADRLIVVTEDHGVVRGIFHNLDQKHLDAALRYVVSRPSRGPSPLAYTMDWLHSKLSNQPRRL